MKREVHLRMTTKGTTTHRLFFFCDSLHRLKKSQKRLDNPSEINNIMAVDQINGKRGETMRNKEQESAGGCVRKKRWVLCGVLCLCLNLTKGCVISMTCSEEVEK